MSEFIKEETIEEIMDVVSKTDGPEFAELYGTICGGFVTVEDAHYRHDELLEEIEVELSQLTADELDSLSEFLFNQGEEDENYF